MHDLEKVKEINWKVPGESKQYSTKEMFDAIQKYARVSGYDYDIAVGTDSQMIGHAFQFISVISVHRIGKGGLYFYNKEILPRAKFPVENQKMRMFEEVSRSITLSLAMQYDTKLFPVIHIDASPPGKKAEFTSQFSEQLKGYVQSCGFECMLKPESYVAHAIADRHTKRKTRKRRGRNKKMLSKKQKK